MEALKEPPQAATFIPLAEHRSATPASFYTGPPVLHYYSDRSKIIVLARESRDNSLLQPLLKHAQVVEQEQNGATNGTSETHDDSQQVVEDVDVWVTSDKLFLYSNTASAGLSISYPTISLHAIQTLPSPTSASSEPVSSPSQGVYMQLLPPPSGLSAEAEQEDEEPDSLSLTIIPTASAPPQGPGSATAPTTADPGDEIETEDQPEQTPAQALFTALSACADLHPDPIEGEDMGEGDEDGIGGSRLVRAGLAIPILGAGAGGDDGLPPPMPGSGGWITAENMHEFVDEDGNWIEDGGEADANDEAGDTEPLGPGAGTIRGREEGQNDGENGGEETKWQKTG